MSRGPSDRGGQTVDAVSRDEQDLARFGYKQELKRTLGGFSSFAVAFSYISPSTGIFALFYLGLTTVGGVFIWSWPIVAIRSEAHSRRLQLLRSRVQLHLTVDRDLRAVLSRSHDRGRRLHLELADRRDRAAARRAGLCGAIEPLSRRRLGLPVDEVPRRQ